MESPATRARRTEGNGIELDSATIEGQAPTTATASAIVPLELTNAVKLKVASATLCFFNAGVNDGSLGMYERSRYEIPPTDFTPGALIPYILRDYSISTGWMAIPYGVAFFGWFLAAIFGGYGRIKLGSGGLIILGAGLQFLAQLLRFWIPPFGLFSVTFFIVALGQATQEPQANTFVSTLQNAHRWLGLIHGCYALGGLAGPLIATAIASTTRGQWATFYYVPTGIGAINLALCAYAFRDDVAFLHHGSETEQRVERHSRTALTELSATAKQRPVWFLSIFFFLYLGAAITAGGWVVEFLVVVRDGDLSRVGYISSAFYGGSALGRILLAEPTFRFGEKRMLLLYGVLSLALEIIFWRVPNVIVDAVMVCLMGVLLGPAFATGVSVGSKLIPVELQPSGLALIFVMAQAGGAIFPAITGVISARAGVGTLQPILVGLLAAMAFAWWLVPDPRKKGINAASN